MTWAFICKWKRVDLKMRQTFSESGYDSLNRTVKFMVDFAIQNSVFRIGRLGLCPLLSATIKPANECTTFESWNGFSLRRLQRARGYLKIDDKSTPFSFRTNPSAAKVQVAGVGTAIEMGKGHPRDDITAESKMAIYDIFLSICHIWSNSAIDNVGEAVVPRSDCDY